MNSLQRTLQIRKWMPTVLAAGFGIIAIFAPLWHGFFWPEWWNWRGLGYWFSYIVSSILILYAFLSLWTILFSDWGLAGIASLSLLSYLTAGAVFVISLYGFLGLEGASTWVYVDLILGWPSWSVWIGSCVLTPGWCLVFSG